MAKVFIEETTLTAIGDAIRGKEGTTELVPVNDMATRITSLPSGGGGGNEPTDEELVVTGNCQYRFAYNGWNWVIDRYGNRITTKDITLCANMFNSSTNLKHIPFDINVTNGYLFSSMFHTTSSLETCPKIRGTVKWSTSTTFSDIVRYASKLRYVDDLLTPEMLDGFSTVKVTSAYTCPKPVNFCDTSSLRRIPEWFYKFRVNPESTAFPTSTATIYYNLVQYAYALDEITNIPVWECKGAATSNMFSTAFQNCYRLRTATFETNPDGTPIKVKWKSQVIDLSKGVGCEPVTPKTSTEEGREQLKTSSNVLKYNSGITIDTLIRNDETYQQFKNHPDAFVCVNTNQNPTGTWSRYTRASAVTTINSLPDTSEYLATAGGTNTIKFKAENGLKTDEGPVSSLTEEEIAVATAKGWTVTLVA